jgi:hypothetical protein
MIMLKMTTGCKSAQRLRQAKDHSGVHILEKVRVTVIAFRGTSQPEQLSAYLSYTPVSSGNATINAKLPRTWSNTTQETTPRQATVTSERPELSRGRGDLVDDSKHE